MEQRPSSLRVVNESHIELSQCRPGERPETVLCVYSFSHNPLAVSLTLPEEFRANKVTDVFGGSTFPAPSEQGHITLALPPQSFYWLSLAGVKASVT